MTSVNAYNIKLDGDLKLSEFFRLHEFQCKDGSDVILVAPELVRVLQKIREWAKAPVTVTSGYRTFAYNKKIKGATSSQHCLGTAADIVVSRKTPKQVAAFAETLLTGRGGIGVYSGFTHVDVRPNRSRWNG